MWGGTYVSEGVVCCVCVCVLTGRLHQHTSPSKSTGVNDGRWSAYGFLVTGPSPTSGRRLAAAVKREECSSHF